MMRLIFSRAAWIFVALTNITALAGLLELLNPKEQQVMFVWSAPFDWIPILLTLVAISIACAATSLVWTRPANLPAK